MFEYIGEECYFLLVFKFYNTTCLRKWSTHFPFKKKIYARLMISSTSITIYSNKFHNLTNFLFFYFI